MKQKLVQQTQIERPIPTEMIDEVPTISIDLTGITEIDPDNNNDKKELIDIEKQIGIQNESNESERLFLPRQSWWTKGNIDGTASVIFKDGKELRTRKKHYYHADNQPTYKNLAGQRVTPTRIQSLLTQNPGDTYRPASTFFWWKQSDEGYYLAKAKQNLPYFLAWFARIIILWMRIQNFDSSLNVLSTVTLI